MTRKAIHQGDIIILTLYIPDGYKRYKANVNRTKSSN